MPERSGILSTAPLLVVGMLSRMLGMLAMPTLPSMLLLSLLLLLSLSCCSKATGRWIFFSFFLTVSVQD